LVAGTTYCHALNVNVINNSHQKKYMHRLSGIVVHNKGHPATDRGGPRG